MSLQSVFSGRVVPNVRSFIADRQPLIWVLAIIIGLGIAYAAIVFRFLIGIVQLPWLFTTSERVGTAAASVAWWQVLLAPAVGGLVVGYLLDKFVSGKRGHSVVDVIEARAIGNCRMDARTGLWSALLSVLSIGTGASVGREGPVVHLGATLAATVQRVFDLPASGRRTLLAAGVAAAVSASFNAPLAGVLFAHEVILAHYSFRAMVPIVIASVAAAVVARLHFGNFPAFILPEYQITSYWEFPAFALLGLTCALVAILLQFAIMGTERAWWSFDLPLWFRGAIGGAVVGAIGIVFPQVLGVGYEATDQALSQKLGLGLMLALIVAKTAATSVSLSSRLVGGVFSPSLYLGAMTGASFGIIATAAFPDVSSSYGLYAILGMGAVAAAVLGAPLSTTLIVFELTGGFAMAIALLLTVSICVGLSQAVLGQSFFHWQLGKRGVFLHEGPHQLIVQSLHVKDFMEPLADGDEVALNQPEVGSDDAQVPPCLMPEDTLERALRIFNVTGLARVAVVKATEPGVVVGWAYRVGALNAFNEALIAANIEEHR